MSIKLTMPYHVAIIQATPLHGWQPLPRPDRGRSHNRPERERARQKFDVVGTCILGIFRQSVNITLKGAVGEKTECAGNLDGILEPPASNIGLPDNGDTRNGSAHESAFHCSESYRLMSANHLGLLIAGRKGNKHGRDKRSERARAQIESSLDRMESSQSIKGSDGCDYERAGHERRHLIVEELHPGPGIQQIGPETGDA